ncbi:hypothetical protein RI065_10115 [Mycoplasmatota bacterium zrk1]
MQYIRDNLGKVLAIITTDSKGVKTIKTYTGEVLGTYDPSTNQTKKWAGEIIGYGDLLTSLIKYD